MTTLFTILFDGVAYGMLLFVLACGLAVTLGLMNFVNLAHGAFAMTGGYVCAVLVNQSGWPFFAALPLAFVASALIGIVLERALYRHLYTRSHLDQVLFSVDLKVAFWIGKIQIIQRRGVISSSKGGRCAARGAKSVRRWTFLNFGARSAFH